MRNPRTLVLLLALARCAPADELEAGLARRNEGVAREPIEGGKVDNLDRGVVGLVVTDDAGYPRRTCSGTLIAPDLVLTAQHCVADTNPEVDCATATFGPTFPPSRVLITASPSMWSARTPWTPASAVIAPPGPRVLCGRDVALVVLQEPLTGPPVDPRLDEVRPDEAYAAVGYGAVDGAEDGSGLRRRRELLRVVCVGEGCGTPQVDRDEWRGDHGICSGDSGGPALDAAGHLLGVTSRGPAGCERPVYGALAPHAAWLRDAARERASASGRATPPWARADASEPESRERAGSCATAPGPGSSGLLAVGAALALAGLFRRARR